MNTPPLNRWLAPRSPEKLREAQNLLKQPPAEASTLLDKKAPEERIELLLALPPGPERQKLILRASDPATLAQSLSPEDFVLTLKEIGAPDALDLLRLSSDIQLNHLFDLELWKENEFRVDDTRHWLGLLFQASTERVLQWVQGTDFELIALYLEDLLVKVEREEVPDLPSERAHQLYTPDQYHFLLILDPEGVDVTRRLLDTLYTHDRERFLALYANSGTLPRTEIEELCSQFKNARLADRGWPDWEEAFSIWVPAKDRPDPSARLPRGIESPPVYPLQVLPSDDPQRWLPEVLTRLTDPRRLELLASELAHLTNCVLVSNHMARGELSALKLALDRLAGRIEIGLAGFCPAGRANLDAALHCVQSTPMKELFRRGETVVAGLRQRGEQLQRQPGAELLSLAESPLPERLAALAERPARFFDDEKLSLREIGGPADCQALEADLARAEAAVALGVGLGLSIAKLPNTFPSRCFPESRESLGLTTWLLTALLRGLAGLDPAGGPLPIQRLTELWKRLPRERRALLEVIQPIVQSLSGKQPAGSASLMDALATLWVEEIAPHDPATRDPRYLGGVWVSLAEAPAEALKESNKTSVTD